MSGLKEAELQFPQLKNERGGQVQRCPHFFFSNRTHLAKGLLCRTLTIKQITGELLFSLGDAGWGSREGDFGGHRVPFKEGLVATAARFEGNRQHLALSSLGTASSCRVLSTQTKLLPLDSPHSVMGQPPWPKPKQR